MPALETLKHRADFLALNAGVRAAKPGFVLLGRQRPVDAAPPDIVRFGLTVSRKNGNAVTRNRIRRRLRVLARERFMEAGKAGWDYVLIARDAAVRRDFQQLRAELESALEMLHKAPRPETEGAARRRRQDGPSPSMTPVKR